MRSFARCARRWASRSGMRSPVYSAILRRRRKLIVAKQPLPLIGDLRIESPRASFRFIWQHYTWIEAIASNGRGTNLQPEGLRESSRRSKRSEDLRNRVARNLHSEGVQEFSFC